MSLIKIVANLFLPLLPPNMHSFLSFSPYKAFTPFSLSLFSLYHVRLHRFLHCCPPLIMNTIFFFFISSYIMHLLLLFPHPVSETMSSKLFYTLNLSFPIYQLLDKKTNTKKQMKNPFPAINCRRNPGILLLSTLL